MHVILPVEVECVRTTNPVGICNLYSKVEEGARVFQLLSSIGLAPNLLWQASNIGKDKVSRHEKVKTHLFSAPFQLVRYGTQQ